MSVGILNTYIYFKSVNRIFDNKSRTDILVKFNYKFGENKIFKKKSL